MYTCEFSHRSWADDGKLYTHPAHSFAAFLTFLLVTFSNARILFLGHFFCIKSTRTVGRPPPGSTIAVRSTEVPFSPSDVKIHLVRYDVERTQPSQGGAAFDSGTDTNDTVTVFFFLSRDTERSSTN